MKATSEGTSAATRWQLIGAFAAVYVIWGSTYLAIRFCIETLPGLLMAGTRFLVAGSVLFGLAMMRGSRLPRLEHWRSALLIGAMLLLIGNGCVVTAERAVPSGLTSLLVATEPLMVVLLDALRPGGSRPSRRSIIGLLVGFGGVALLIGQGKLAGAGQVDLKSAAIVLMGALSWAAGSVYGPRASMPDSPLLASGMQMLCGGTLLMIVGTANGDWAGFDPATVSLRSASALAYLVVFGSLVGFTCYGWLVRNVRPSLVATYAYVNPVVAVFLGWLLAGEPLTLRTVVAAAIIVSSVAMMSSQTPPSSSASAEQAELEPHEGPELITPASSMQTS